MTRINLIDPQLLTDQHLMAEYRELPRIFGLAEKHFISGKPMPKTSGYKLGAGHVIFFYDKLQFLVERQEFIIIELLERGFNISHTDVTYPNLDSRYFNNWTPSESEIQESRSRLKEKLLERVHFYKFWSKPVDGHFYG